MAALGTVTVYAPVAKFRPTLVPISGYKIQRGSHLGAISVYDAAARHRPALAGPVVDYVVRQLITRYRQIWPAYGQRFPQ
jgi:hypothetical protein